VVWRCDVIATATGCAIAYGSILMHSRVTVHPTPTDYLPYQARLLSFNRTSRLLLLATSIGEGTGED
jgi:hypothetical protein